MRPVRSKWMILPIALLLVCGWIVAQDETVDEVDPTETSTDEVTPDGEDDGGGGLEEDGEPDDLGTDGTTSELYGAVKGLTNALQASDNRSENAVAVLTSNLERAMERQGIGEDPMDPVGADGDVDSTGDPSMETEAYRFDDVTDVRKPAKPERLQRPDKPERPEKPERPGKPDRP